MKYREEVASFCSAGAQLIGILARPEQPAATGVVVLVGGPQYRAGSHRQFVLLARALASAGYAVLRFDYQGMGDSEGEPHDFQSVGADIGAAISTLQQRVPGVTHVALWGLCDGASAALLYCLDSSDARVSALCLANPWVRSETSLAATQVRHYYLQRLFSGAFWRKLLRGEVDANALPDLARSLRTLLRSRAGQKAGPDTFQQRMASAWLSFSGRIFLLLSENDYTAKEFLQHAHHDRAWKNALRHPQLVRRDQRGADHTFSSADLRTQVAELTLRYGLSASCGRPPKAT